MEACKHYYSVRYVRLPDLLLDLQAARANGTFSNVLKKYTFNLAESFAREKSGGKKVTYTNPIAVAKNGGWRYGYGNMFYVELVNQYLTCLLYTSNRIENICRKQKNLYSFLRLCWI